MPLILARTNRNVSSTKYKRTIKILLVVHLFFIPISLNTKILVLLLPIANETMAFEKFGLILLNEDKPIQIKDIFNNKYKLRYCKKVFDICSETYILIGLIVHGLHLSAHFPSQECELEASLPAF